MKPNKRQMAEILEQCARREAEQKALAEQLKPEWLGRRVYFWSLRSGYARVTSIDHRFVRLHFEVVPSGSSPYADVFLSALGVTVLHAD